jgi:pyruvate dehydrogenase E1 component alpha subunit
MFQIMDPEGQIVAPDRMPKWSDEKIREIYETMVFLRLADFKLLNLQRQGRSGSYPSIEGQEACQVGSGLALEKTDWVFPSFRELAIQYIHGVPLEKIYLYWMGNEWGSNYDAHVAPVSIPVGTHPLHAVGFAWARKIQKKSEITISYFGDGATSEGDVYEAMNFAGVLKIPTVFFCQNNQWAISVPRKKQTAAETLAQKAVAAGFPGIQIDGNDVFASFVATQEAVKRAREGQGPTFIEAVTYRFGNHTTSDDALKYRPREEVDFWRKRDPLLRIKLYLQKKNLWSEEWQTKIEEAAREKILAAAKAAEETPRPEPNEIFDYMYEKLPPALQEQKEYLLGS